MGVQRDPVQVVAQDRVGGDFLPRAALMGLPPTVGTLTRLGPAANAPSFVPVSARPTGFRLKFAIPVVILRVAITMVATLRACRLVHDCARKGNQHNHEERNKATTHNYGLHLCWYFSLSVPPPFAFPRLLQLDASCRDF